MAKILVDSELLERLHNILNCGAADEDIIVDAADELSAALDAPQQEAVAEVTNSGTGAVLYRDANLEDGDLLYTNPALSVPEGWQLVPKEPTEEMLSAISWECDPSGYVQMLSAAPKAPTTDDRKDAERWRTYTRMLFDPHGDWPDSISGAQSLEELESAVDTIASQKGEVE